MSNYNYHFSIKILFTLAINLLPTITHSLVFNISRFDSNPTLVRLEGDAKVSPTGDIELTKLDHYRVGRVVSSEPLRLYDSSNGTVADFTTRFSFRLQIFYGKTDDGLALFLAPVGYPIPPHSAGTYFGLLNETTVSDMSRNQIVMVEFDSYQNAPPDTWDPEGQHVAINVNSIASLAYAPWDATSNSGKTAHVSVSYDSTTKNLSVTWSYEGSVDPPGFVSYAVDLKKFLPEVVTVGISSSTGLDSEEHTISSWEFYSSLDLDVESGCLSLPKRFTYQELVNTTNGFAEDRKLGRGGSGHVYKGTLRDLDRQVAVKRIFGESEHSERIVFNEVKVISRVMHRNLVQFVGWCQEQKEILLVYDYMPNGSLDNHLFGDRKTLPWDVSTKRGDFGVAKLVDPQLRTDRMTPVVGTIGYLAPEYVSVGRVCKESDMYSFGVVALEIACGKRSVYQEGEYHVTLMKRVWELHLGGNIREAADERLDMEFNPNQMDALLKVGLWCTNPNERERPKAGEVIKVLQLDAPMPELNKPHELHFAVELHPVPSQQTTDSTQTASLPPYRSVASRFLQS
ncbi:L-type lectin-domain containing receptor kinase IX.1 [Morus notabilis]|uniref:L-type lectin-domain containing receptor kinase IX.1 n=1 Tax=Morus notabilis TaxID=981085 RepID=W9RP06_9ROSA|nr:L-type lectin-domain containing receptor kinase IX.1 [Morus notabilis]